MILSPRVRLATLIAAAASTLATLVLVSVAAPAAQAAGVRNCTDLTRPSPACYELVWLNGVEVKMTFPQSGNPRPIRNAEVNSFYVIAPQTDEVQGTLPFRHDHTVGVAPAQNRGPSVFWHGYFVVCSETGISSGRCVFLASAIPGLGNAVPLAESVDGQMLTSVEVIESYVDAGLLTLIDTGAEFIGTISPAH
jgi:hypothetical protein